MKGSRHAVKPVLVKSPLFFSAMKKPAWWRRHVVMFHMGSRAVPIVRSWFLDRTELLTRFLNDLGGEDMIDRR